jgi:phenylacetate-CoA ligase
MPNSIAERIYYKLPSTLQNITVSAYGLKLRQQRYNRAFKTYLDDLKRSEWISKEKMLDYQNRKIIQLIKHAYNTVPFYKSLYDEYGVDISQVQTIDDLSQLPILSKKQVKAAGDQLLSSNFKKQRLIKTLTSGTTGMPLEIYQTKDSINLQWAIFWRARARFGLTIHDRHLMFGARMPISHNHQAPPFWRHDYFNNRVYISTNHIHEKTVNSVVDYLNSTHFDFFVGYPTAIYNFARLIKEKNLRLYNRPKIVVFSSDTVLTKQEEIISEVFGVPVTEFYGMVEFAGTMSKCEHERFHVDHEHCFIENHQIDNSKSHKLIMTGWGNYAMPFIRYDVGDFGTPSISSCKCGRESDSYFFIDGRLEDFITTPDGRKLSGMNQVFKHANNVLELQLYQEKISEVIFRIVPDVHFSDNDKTLLINEFRKRAGDEIEIRFNFVDSIKKTSKGKFRAVISELD